MSEERHKKIIKAIVKEAERINYGEITIRLTAHEGKFKKGEVIEERRSLG